MKFFPKDMTPYNNARGRGVIKDANNGTGNAGGDADSGAGSGDDIVTAPEGGEGVKYDPTKPLEMADDIRAAAAANAGEKPMIFQGTEYKDGRDFAASLAPSQRLVDDLTTAMVPSQLDNTTADESPLSRLEGESLKVALMAVADAVHTLAKQSPMGIGGNVSDYVRGVLFPEMEPAGHEKIPTTEPVAASPAPVIID